MDNKNNSTGSQGNNFVIGFLLGSLVGAAVVFLLGTEKGKRLLKVISEEGIDNISNILEEANKTEGSDEVYEEETPSFAKASRFAEASRDKSEGRGEFAIKEKSIEEKPRVRRFFRGISRRVN